MAVSLSPMGKVITFNSKQFLEKNEIIQKYYLKEKYTPKGFSYECLKIISIQGPNS